MELDLDRVLEAGDTRQSAKNEMCAPGHQGLTKRNGKKRKGMRTLNSRRKKKKM